MDSKYGTVIKNSEHGSYTTEGYELSKENEFDAGLDICANEFVVIEPHTRGLVSTGIRVAIPEGYVGLLWSRSGISSKQGVEVGAGCIDSTYRGEVKVLLYNHSDVPFTVMKGNRIAQLLTVPILTTKYEKVDSLDDTSRGEGGFGSTGV